MDKIIAHGPSLDKPSEFYFVYFQGADDILLRRYLNGYLHKLLVKCLRQ
jgi:hypothetical protein